MLFIFAGFIGVAKDIVEIINHKTINDMDDDQLYYTKIFLDKNLRVSQVYQKYMYVIDLS